MGYDRIVYIRYHFSCGLDRKDACWLSFTPLTGVYIYIYIFVLHIYVQYAYIFLSSHVLSVTLRYGRWKVLVGKRLIFFTAINIATLRMFTSTSFFKNLPSRRVMRLPITTFSYHCLLQILVMQSVFCSYHHRFLGVVYH